MELIIGLIILIVIINIFTKNYDDGNKVQAVKRSFGCDECGSRYWVIQNTSHYNTTGS